MLNISFAGAGNAAYRLSLSLKAAGCNVSYIWNRTPETAGTLAKILNKHENNPHNLDLTIATENICNISDSDIILLTLSDDAIKDVFSIISEFDSVKSGRTIVCHTSGATSIDVLNSIPHYGVFYPLMTLSKTKPVDMKIVPFLLESSDMPTHEVFVKLCDYLGAEYRECNSESRLRMHLAAVYVSNFVNYLLGLSYDISSPYHTFLLPLATETVRKAFLYGHPGYVQTGPAARNDTTTILKHLEILKDMDEHRAVYELITKQIANSSKKFKKK
ncbi:MAG: hypothetical protein ACD_77C00346G0026 [uncultured bacterium]|nr:MAG: hypothetical protein ACD_77C00346G0026 [uncultured bacterium]